MKTHTCALKQMNLKNDTDFQSIPDIQKNKTYLPTNEHPSRTPASSASQCASCQDSGWTPFALLSHKHSRPKPSVDSPAACYTFPNYSWEICFPNYSSLISGHLSLPQYTS